MCNIEKAKLLYGAGLSLEKIDSPNRKEIVYNLLRFCKGKGATEFEMEFLTPNPDTGKPVINPDFLGHAMVCVSKPGEIVRYEKLSGKGIEDKLHYVHAKFGNKFIDWYKENELMTWLPFDLNLFNDKDQLIANFTEDHSLIGISYLNRGDVELLKKMLKLHLAKMGFSYSKMKKVLYIGLSSPNKKETLRNFHRKLSFAGYKFYEHTNEYFYSQVIANAAVKKVITAFDWGIFSRPRKIWSPDEVSGVFIKLEEELKEKQDSLPKKYYVSMKEPDSNKWNTFGYARFEISGKSYFFSCVGGVNQATVEFEGEKSDLLNEQSPFKIGEEYSAKYLDIPHAMEGKKVIFKISSQPLYATFQYVFDEAKRLCHYAKEKGYKVSIGAILQ